MLAYLQGRIENVVENIPTTQMLLNAVILSSIILSAAYVINSFLALYISLCYLLLSPVTFSIMWKEQKCKDVTDDAKDALKK